MCTWDNNFYIGFIALGVKKTQNIGRQSTFSVTPCNTPESKKGATAFSNLCYYVIYAFKFFYQCQKTAVVIILSLFFFSDVPCIIFRQQVLCPVIACQNPGSGNFTKTKHSSMFAYRRGVWLSNIRKNKRDMIIQYICRTSCSLETENHRGKTTVGYIEKCWKPFLNYQMFCPQYVPSVSVFLG